MAQEFNIPGLKGALADLKALTDATNKLSKDLLTTAINGEKAVKSFSGSGIKDHNEQLKKSNETQKETKAVADKLVQAEEKLRFSQSDLAKQIAAANLQTQQQNQINKASVDVINQAVEASKKENTTIVEARANIALLTQARNNVNVTTTEGKAQLITFNDALDKNNKFIKDNADAALKQKMGIGDYAGGVKAAMEQTGLFSGKIGQLSNTAIGFVQAGAKAVTKIKDVSDSVVAASKTTAGYITAKVKMIATEKAATIAVEEETIAVEGSTVAKEISKTVVTGFTQAERLSVIATETSTIATTGNIAATEGMSVAQVGLIATTEATVVSEEVATATTWGLNSALGVLLFPITAVVLALGILVYIFKDFQPIINPVKDAFAALMAVFEVLKSSIFAIVTGSKSLGEVFSTLGSETSKAADEAYKLADAQRQVVKAERELELSTAKAQAQITKLLVMSKNRTKDEEERIALIDKAIKIEKEDVANKLTLNNKKIANARLVLAEGKTISEEDMELLAKGNANYAQSIKKKYNLDQEAIDNLRKLQVERYSILEKSSAVEEKAMNLRDKIEDRRIDKEEKAKEQAEKNAEKAEKDREAREKKAEDDAKKSFEFLISAKKLTLDNIISSYKQEENLEDANLAHIRAVSMEKQVIANLEMQKNKIGVKDKQDLMLIEQKGSEEVIKIKQEESEELKKVQLDNSKFELELYDLTHQSQLDGEKKLTDLLIAEEKKRLKESLELHRQGMREELNIDKELSDSKLKEMAKSNAKLTQNQLRYLQWLEKETIKTDKDIKKADSDLLESKVKNIETQVKTEDRKFKLLGKGATANAKNEIANEKKELLAKRELYKGNADKIAEIDLQLAENQQKLDDLVKQNKIDALNQGFNSLVEVAGKESAVGKAAAIAQATMNTYLAITKTLSAFPGPIGIALSVLTGVAGFLSVTKIAGINAFAVGTDNAPYTGQAIVDEEGAEIHTDKYGRIKSFGQAGGARVTDITKGDKVIPADISAMIKGTLFAKSIGKGDVIDYDKIGEQFGKHAGKIVGAINNKKESNFSVVVQKNITDRVRFKKRNV